MLLCNTCYPAYILQQTAPPSLSYMNEVGRAIFALSSIFVPLIYLLYQSNGLHILLIFIHFLGYTVDKPLNNLGVETAMFYTTLVLNSITTGSLSREAKTWMDLEFELLFDH